VTALDCRKDIFPLTLDIGSIGMHLKSQPCAGKDLLASGNVRRQRNPNSNWDDAQIHNNVHRILSVHNDTPLFLLMASKNMSNATYNRHATTSIQS
jgi:hypothetical protein